MLCDEFPAEYKVIPPGETVTSGLRAVEFRANPGLGPAPRIEIVVVPVSAGQAWLGHFYGHRDGVDLLARSPDPDHLLAVAGGVAYWVPIAGPEGFKVVPFEPVRSVHCSSSNGLLILEGHTKLMTLERNGSSVWQSARLVSDGFSEVRVATSAIIVRGYWAPEDREIELRLDVLTGATLDG